MRNGLLQYPSVSSSDSSDNWVYDNFLSSPTAATSPDPAPLPPVVLSEEAIQSEAAQTGPFTEVTVSSGGITFDLLFDAAASSAAAASFRAGIEQAASMLAATITDKITINLEVDWSGTGGGASSGPTDGTFEPYSTVYSDLVNNAPAGSTLFNALPNSSSVQGQSEVAVWNAQLKLWGLPVQSGSPTVVVNGVTYTVDGSSTFATDINSSELVGVALHEITHAMGRVPYGSQPDVFDLFRFTSAGTMLFSSAIPTSAAYFSVDGGKTVLANYGLYSDPSDFLNAGPDQLGTPYSSLTPNDPFDELYGGNTTQKLTALDIEQLNVLGFHTTTGTTTGSPSASTSSIVSSQSTVAADGHSTTTLTVTVEDANHDLLSGVAVTLSASGSGNIFGSISGTTNANGVFTTTLASTLAQSEVITATENGVQEQVTVNFGKVLQTDGTTELVQVGNDYFFENTSTGTSVELQYDGAPVVVGQFAPWTPIGAIQTANGYEVALKFNGASYFSIWDTDSNGNYLSNTTTLSGSSPVLETFETSFHQDLNGDSVIGPPAGTTVIESYGSTSLVQVGNDYYFENNSTGAGPELKMGGAAVTVGEYSPWTFIGVEQTSTGYEVALQFTGSQYFSIWTTDSNGNYISNSGSLLGSSTALENLETSFHQDLNGDGVIGPPTGTVIEADGSTSLVQVGNNYFLDNISTGAGPELTAGGTPVVVGQFSPWTVIGAEQTSTGYEVALQFTGSQYFSIWTTDSNGNYISSTVALLGSSTQLETYETSFHQDLNGDGIIGIPSGVSATSASAIDPIASSAFMTWGGGNDTFRFNTSPAAAPVASGNAAETFEPAADLFPALSSQHWAATDGGTAAQPHPFLPSSYGVSDTGDLNGPSSGTHADFANFHPIDTHAHSFIIA
jgi:serralysin